MKQKNDQELIDNALHLMESDESEAFVDEFNKSLVEAVKKTQGIYSAHIESAIELTDEEKQRIEALLTGILKNKLAVHFSITPALIGGFKITVGDWKLDATIANQLEKIKDEIIQ